MTPEQEKQVAEIRKAHEIAKLKLANLGIEPVAIAAHLDRGGLLTIFDNLQKQQPKQYTEAELKQEFRKRWELASTFAPGGFDDQIIKDHWSGWIQCARFLGVIKTEGE